MRKLDNAAVIGGYFAIAGAFALGVATLAVFMPVWADHLVEANPEYRSQSTVIRPLISAPVAIFELIALEVAYLLWLVHRDRMFSARVFKWVNLLGVTFLALATSFIAIGAWLTIKETLPPAVALVLAALSIVAAAVGLVTRSLLVLLRRATNATQELEGVI
jgi:hypothetical protein